MPVPERLWAFAPNMPEKGKEASKKGKEPFTQQYEVKDVFPHFCDRKTKLLALQDVPYVLRAMGLTIYVDEEKGIREQLEKVDGNGQACVPSDHAELGGRTWKELREVL